MHNKKLSVEAEAVRYTTGLVCNLTAQLERARLVYIQDSNRPLSDWKVNSLQDNATRIFLRLAKDSETMAHLKEIGAYQALEAIEGKGGIHDFCISFSRMRFLE